MEDNGIKFNPLEKEDPDTTLSVEDRQIGGIFFIAFGIIAIGASIVGKFFDMLLIWFMCYNININKIKGSH